MSGRNFDIIREKLGELEMRPGIWQILICAVIVALLFGAKKIPELARALGKAKGEFKKGLAEGAREDDETPAVTDGEKSE